MRRTFKIEEHPEYGYVGLSPTWMSHEQSDPMSGMGVAHDILEHGDADVVEWQGLGGSVYVRGEDYYAQRSRGNSNAAENIGSEWINLYHLWEGQEIPTPPATRPLSDEEAENLIQASVRAGMENVRVECIYDQEDVTRWTSEAQRQRMVGWMRLGYRAAARRWRKHDRYMLMETFVSIEKRVDEFLKREGDESQGLTATVAFAVDRAEARVTVNYDYDY